MGTALAAQTAGNRRAPRVVSELVRISNAMDVLSAVHNDGAVVLLRTEMREKLFVETFGGWTGWHYFASLGKEIGIGARNIMQADPEISNLRASCGTSVGDLLRRG